MILRTLESILDLALVSIMLIVTHICNLLRPLIKILFLLAPYGYIIIKVKKS